MIWSLNPAVPQTGCMMSGHLGLVTQDLKCPFQPSVCGSSPRAINPDQAQSEILEPFLAGANKSHRVYRPAFPFFFPLCLDSLYSNPEPSAPACSQCPVHSHFPAQIGDGQVERTEASTLLKRKGGRPLPCSMAAAVP